MLNVIRTAYIDQQEYKDERYRFIESQEGRVARIYTDSLGIPTVGVGYAFPKGISRVDAQNLLRGAFNNSTFTLTDAQ